MRRGKLRNQVIIQAATNTPNSFGELIASWATLATVWAGIDPVGASEQITGDRANEKNTHRVTIDYLSTVTANNRILYGSRVLNINGIEIVDERNRVMMLNCSEVK